jgi:hypothetical protein
MTDMFRRYSAPIICLDLVKQHEKRARESLVGKEFRQAVEVLNESICSDKKIRYIALDYSRITSLGKKSRGGKGGPSGPGGGYVRLHVFFILFFSLLLYFFSKIRRVYFLFFCSRQKVSYFFILPLCVVFVW